jgi:dihydrofolate reductase
MPMTKVYTEASMSLDGYIAGPDESGFDQLFRWYADGNVTVSNKSPDQPWLVSEASAGHLRELLDNTGALIVGRRLFDLAGGWGGTHPIGVPVVVLTHDPPDDWARGETPYSFVSEGIEAAVDEAHRLAGDRWVGVNGGQIARQCVNAGLLDEIRVNLVPVLLGGGVHYLDQLAAVPMELDDPTVVEGTGVTHLYYPVRHGDDAD